MQQASRVGCQRCPALCQSRKSIVDGAGRLDSLLLVVGDMPRREDDRSGNPFVGQDGQLLRSTISEACVRLGVDGSRVYYTNSIRCRPSYQRQPEQEELDNCQSWLEEELLTILPMCVLAVGATAQTAVATALEGAGLPATLVKRAYHPAFILKNRSKLANWTQQVEEAVRRAFSLSSEDAPTVNKDVPQVATSVPSSGDWTFGAPDLTSRWLSVDTEFDDLAEEGSHGSRMVGWSISDGVSSEFYTVPAVVRVPLPERLRPDTQTQALEWYTSSTSLDVGDQSRTDSEGDRRDAPMPQQELRGDQSPSTWDTSDEHADVRPCDLSGQTEVHTGTSETDSMATGLGSDTNGSSASTPCESRDYQSFVKGRRLPVYIHNAKADLVNLGIDPDDLDAYEDTMLMAYVTRRFPRVGLKVLGPLLAGVEW